jgi:hypothetical protein
MVDSYAFDSQSAKVVAGYVMKTKEGKSILICAVVLLLNIWLFFSETPLQQTSQTNL